MIARFRVDVRPVPKERARVLQRGAKRIAITPDNTAAYANEVIVAYRQASGGWYEDRPVALLVTIYEGPWAGDFDNHAKAVSDALNHVAWEDDKQVLLAVQRVFRAGHGQQPHAEVLVCDLEEFWTLAPEDDPTMSRPR